MSPVNRTRSPRTGSLRCRLLAGAIAAAAVSTSGFPTGPVFAQTIVVSGGAVQSNSTPTTYDSLQVYGTDGSSNPSTYNADASLTLAGILSAYDSGVFNANANVSVGASAGSRSGGVINLNAGTLTATQGLSFDGVGSVTQTAGNYSTDYLSLSSGAALGYGTGDAIANSVSVSGGSTLTLDQNLTLSGYLNLDNGGSISRTTETISALSFDVSNATLNLIAGDTFNPSYSNSVRYGAVVNAPAGTSLGYLTVQGTNGNGDRATFNVNGDVTVNQSASAYSDGVINLIAGTLSAQSLSFDAAGSVTQAAGSYSTNSLNLSNGAALGYGTGDTITGSVTLYSGAALTLAKDLSITGGLTINGASTSLVPAGQNYSISDLNLANGAALTYGSGDAIANSVSVSGGSTLTLDQNLTLSGYLNLDNGGSISRTTETISALSFDVSNATLNLIAGDTFNPSYSNSVRYGAVVNAPAGTSLGYLTVQGTNGNGDRATFNVNGDVTVNQSASAYSDGVINLIAGTLSAPSLVLGGVGSVGQSGGHYDVTNLSLYGGATLAFGIGDSIDSLSIMDAGSRLDGLAPLTLTSLSLTNGGILYLGAFTGTGVISNWGLRMAGDDKSFLENLIFAGLITDGPSPLQVIFDPVSNMTYVTSTPGAVPEIDPNTAHGAVMLLVGAAGILERRLRRVALAR